MKKQTSIVSMILSALHKNAMYINIVAVIYFGVLIAYDLSFGERKVSDIAVTYIALVFMCAFLWFGVRLILWIVGKSITLSTKVLRIVLMIVLVVFALSTLLLGITFFLEGFIVGAFFPPICILSMINYKSLIEKTVQ